MRSGIVYFCSYVASSSKGRRWRRLRSVTAGYAGGAPPETIVAWCTLNGCPKKQLPIVRAPIQGAPSPSPTSGGIRFAQTPRLLSGDAFSVMKWYTSQQQIYCQGGYVRQIYVLLFLFRNTAWLRTHAPCVPTCQMEIPFVSFVLLSPPRQNEICTFVLMSKHSVDKDARAVRPYLSNVNSLCFFCSSVCSSIKGNLYFCHTVTSTWNHFYNHYILLCIP